jgi:hypothetical protein
VLGMRMHVDRIIGVELELSFDSCDTTRFEISEFFIM